MTSLSSVFRIVVGLVSLAISNLLIAGLLGLIPNPATTAQRQRAAFCESTAISFMALAPRTTVEEIRETLATIASRQPDLESMAVRKSTGELVVTIGHHQKSWESVSSTPANGREFIVPISSNGEVWGGLEVRFAPVRSGPWGLPIRIDAALAVFMGIGLSVSFYVYLRKVLRQLNPSRVVPPRVREALDALAEGLLVLDRQERIVLANSAFGQCTGTDPEQWVGKNVTRIGFRIIGDQAESGSPWGTTIATGNPVRGLLAKYGSDSGERTFSINAVPINDDRGKCRGAVATFEDVTELDRKQRELREALSSLKQSSEEIRQQNSELEWLATRDALTGCINRRSFFKIFDEEWARTAASRNQHCAMMVDIDHFKSINDNHGHAMGDEVLRRVAAVIMQTAADGDIVCRYGGEEFSVLMPEIDLDEAELRAERIRLAIMGLTISELKVTASLGLSSSIHNATSPQDLLDQADKCLYVAKRHGRNQVVRFDKAQAQIARLGDTQAPTRHATPKPAAAVSIPFQAVTALVSAMSFRDHRTAAHCRRVADLCVMTAEGLLSMRDCYTLEIAALLHDIGKIGIPDNILHKVGRLTTEEWEVMRRHNAVGVQLVKSSFGSDALTEIIEQQALWFDGSNRPRQQTAVRPSLPSRILAIADAYDSMTSDASYRKRQTRAQAFAELRRCAGTQFDTELVERVISAVKLHANDRSDMPQVSTDTALNIGLQIEQLVSALDDQNLDELKELTQKLHATAENFGISHISNVAMQLQQALKDDNDLISVMQIANELLDLCRLTQVSLIHGKQHSVSV